MSKHWNWEGFLHIELPQNLRTLERTMNDVSDKARLGLDDAAHLLQTRAYVCAVYIRRWERVRYSNRKEAEIVKLLKYFNKEREFEL